MCLRSEYHPLTTTLVTYRCGPIEPSILLQNISLVPYKVLHYSYLRRYTSIVIIATIKVKRCTRVGRAGDHNHLIGYITYPAYSIGPVRKLRNEYLNSLSSSSPEFRKVIIQHVLLLILWGTAFSIDWRQTFILIIVPQLIGIHFNGFKLSSACPL